MRRQLALLAGLVSLAACGGSSGAHQDTGPTPEQQFRSAVILHLNGQPRDWDTLIDAAEEACRLDDRTLRLRNAVFTDHHQGWILVEGLRAYCPERLTDL